MTNKYVLFPAGSVVVLLIMLAGTARADFFNDQWYEQQRRAREDDTSVTIGGRRIGEPLPRPETDESGEKLPYVHFAAPSDILKPFVTVTDSIDVKNGVVRRTRGVTGLTMERYYTIPLTDYMRDSISLNQERIWRSAKTARMEEWTTGEGGGISELDIVIPVGERFERLVGGTTNINIDGSQRIEFSGRSEYDEGVVATATATNNKFPSLTMKQEPQFTIRGNIGDRLKIDIQQDSQTGPFSNLSENISIKYEGRENDILQYIEAGNTSLNLPGATFAGYSGTHQGLFGIRTETQLGPIEVTAIASQEKGESNTKTFRGSAEESSAQIRDYQYKANTYFFLDFYYRDQFAQSRDDLSRILYDPADSIAVIEVYINDSNNLNDTDEATLAYPGVAWPMELATGIQDSSEAARIEGFFHRMDPSEYYISRELGFIQFNRRLDDNWTVGVYMKTKGDSVRGIPAQQFGRLEYDSTRPAETKNVFKLIKQKNQRPTDTDTWNLEWKNVYDLGQRNIDLDGLEIKIYREATDGVSRDKQNNISFIQILGLDRVDETGDPASKPDNKVDFNRGLVDPYRGELIFPLLRPFDAPLPPAGVDVELAEKVPQIYDSANQNERVEATTYYIEVKTAQQQSVIRVDAGFGGILENSETVTLNGRPLVRGTDYRINYMTGEITFLNEEAMSPNADISIDYQEVNAFQPMQKTLFGVRGEYDLWAESRLGAVFLFNNESTQEKRVRLGNEPSRMMLFDMDADLNFQPRFLTTAVDLLPGIVANTPSRVRLQAEYARSMPTMNTHGEVYIDDFEGSQDTPLSVMRTNWNTSSAPVTSTTAGSKIRARGRLQWFNPWDRIDSRDIWPKKETVAGENTVHVLSLAYGKTTEQGVADDESFAGVTNPFWGAGVDLSRARYLEIWARGGKGVLKIDLGSISEDFYPRGNPNGKLDTEDRPIPGLGQGDGILTEDEDTGFDGVFDKGEPGYSAANPDPSGDNFGYDESNRNNYSRINGTEGNASDLDRIGIPDTEDINRNGILDTKNAYYEYSIDFGDRFDPYLVGDTVPEGRPDGWRLFRIPLWGNPQAARDGTPDPPDSTLIEFIRLWITGTDTTYIQIAEMKITESRWLEQGIYSDDDNLVLTGDDVVRVANKSIHENLEYESPPGVKGELDRETKIRQNEQSIVIEVEDLDPGNAGIIYRNFEKMDFTDYTSLKMYVHGPDDFPISGAGGSEYEFIARFGADKNNYYEYRMPLYRGWAMENNMDIDFATCTELKLTDEYGFDTEKYAQELLDSLKVDFPDSLAQVVADSLALDMAEALVDSLYLVRDGKTYAIKGNPSLNNIRVIQFGLRNNQEIGPLTSEIWLDELRMDDLRNMEGTASRVALDTDFAGFMQIQGRVENQSDDFHGMNAKKGSGKSTTSWNSNVRLNLDRFTPRRWNLNVSVMADVSESEALPRLKSGSDIILPRDQKDQYRDYTSEHKARFSYKKGRDQTKTGLLGVVNRWAFENVSFDYDWGERNTIDPNAGIRDFNNQQMQVRYDVATQAKGFVLLGWMPELPSRLGRSISNATFNYTPSTLNYTYRFNEKNTYTTDIDGNIEEPLQIKTADEVANLSYNPFNAISYVFQLTRQNDLYLKKEVQYREDNKLSVTGPELFYLSNKYSYNIVYDEDNDPKYSLSSQLGSRTIAFTKSFTANADFSVDRLLEERLSGRPSPPQAIEPTDSDRPTWGDWFDWFGGEDEKRSEEAAPAETEPADEADAEPEASVIQEPPRAGDTRQTDGDGDEDEEPSEGARTVVVMAVSEALSPLTLEYRRDAQLNYAGITDRPGFMVRIGRGEISPPDTTSVVSSRNTSNQTHVYNASTRIALPLDIGFRVNARMEFSEMFTSSVSEEAERSTFPDITFNMTRIDERIGILKRFLSNMSFNSTFTVTGEKRYQNESRIPNADVRNISFAPLVGLNTRVLDKYDVSFSLSTSDQESRTLSGEVISVSNTGELTTVTTVRYRITATQGLPLFRNIKLRSDIDLTGEFRTRSSQTERAVGDESPALIEDDSESSFSLNGNYRFSESIRGGASLLFQTTKNITKRIHKVREVSVWCELRF